MEAGWTGNLACNNLCFFSLVLFFIKYFSLGADGRFVVIICYLEV